MNRVVRLAKQKLNGNEGTWLTYHLGDDAHGSWLFHPEGTLYTGRLSDGRELECYSGVPEEPGCPILHFVSDRGGWVAQWRRVPWTGVTVDLCRPVEREGDVWRFVDLELDLWFPADQPDAGDDRPRMSRNGKAVGFADDDELDEAVNHGWVSKSQAARTRAEAEQVAGWMLDAIGPFNDHAWERFDQAVSWGLPAPHVDE